MENIAFIDGQNLYMGTSVFNNDGKIIKKSWLDLRRFRVFLKEKYNVEKAYYFLGVVENENDPIYEKIQEAGFILIFRKHDGEMLGSKKGNVDVDLVFSAMKKLYKNEIKNKIILVSGDGDYFKMVKFFIEENKFERILFPKNKNASSLYKKLGRKYFISLGNEYIKNKISKKDF